MKMGNIVVTILLCFMVSCKVLNQLNGKQTAIQMRIDFQDFFIEDTISIRINDRIFIDDKLITSNTIIGHTGFIVSLSNPDKLTICNTNIRLSSSFNLKDHVRVSVVLNGNEEAFDIDLNKGSFIGFDRKGAGVRFNQSKKPFFYD